MRCARRHVFFNCFMILWPQRGKKTTKRTTKEKRVRAREREREKRDAFTRIQKQSFRIDLNHLSVINISAEFGWPPRRAGQHQTVPSVNFKLLDSEQSAWILSVLIRPENAPVAFRLLFQGVQVQRWTGGVAGSSWNGRMSSPNFPWTRESLQILNDIYAMIIKMIIKKIHF